MARTVLDGGKPAEFQPLFNLWTACTKTGTVMDDELKNVLASFGLKVSKAATVTTSDVLQAAGILLYKLDNAPIVSVELITNPPNTSSKLIALGEPDILVSRADVALDASKKKLSSLACKFFTSWAPSGDRSDTLCDAVADVAFDLAKLSLLDKHVTDQMNFYAVTSHAYVRMFMPLLSMMNGTKDYLGNNATYLVKNSVQMGALKDLLESKPSDVLAYMAFHTTVYLSPYLKGKEDLWGHAMFMLTGSQRPQPVPKWRLCLRLVDKLLPGPLVVAFEMADSSKPFFADLVARIVEYYHVHLGQLSQYNETTELKCLYCQGQLRQ
ncbi:uncharacterized protein [Dermacentor andersoni]|uniref:uncharacterized protein n=1 Tax=Dermacentor andersoni TaxID=34620 RepID=UPI003B3A2060